MRELMSRGLAWTGSDLLKARAPHTFCTASVGWKPSQKKCEFLSGQ